MILVFRNSLGVFLAFFCLFQKVEAKTDELIEFKTQIEEVRSSLTKINQNLQKLKAKHAAEISPVPEFSTLKKSESFILQKPNVSVVESSHARNVHSTGKVVGFDPSGFYILPFLGLLNSENLTWDSSLLGEFEVEEGVGTSTGLSIGYEVRNFFSDIQLSYVQNRMKKMDLPFSASFSGTTKGLGIHLTGGGRIHFNEYISCSLGAGIGGVDQDMSFLLSGLLVQEKDFLMSYQIFSGIEYRPVDFSSLGVRYRWLHIDEMDIFSSRDLHLIELWLGYLF